MRPSVYFALIVATGAVSLCQSFGSPVSKSRRTSPSLVISPRDEQHDSDFSTRLSMAAETLPEADAPSQETLPETNSSTIQGANSTEDSTCTDTSEKALLSDRASDDGRTKLRALVAAAGLTALSATIVAAKLGLLPGIPSADGTYSTYTDGMIARDTGASLLSFGLGYGFVKATSALAKNGILDTKDSRKIIHTFSGPLFIVVWPLFSAASGARFFAAIVPIMNALRLYLAAVGEEEESELANAVSRSGNAKEALGGPFLYVVTLAAAILLFWRESLPGIIAVSTMAAGDGMADIVGRRLGKNNKWFFSKSKSMAGSLAFAIASTLTSILLAAWMSYTGCLTLPLPLSELAPRIAAISVACAGVELVPIGDDNWTVPLSATILAMLFLT